jgi:hypothetical protein
MTLDWRDIERAASVQLGVVHIGLGVAILVGGPGRFTAPTYEAMLRMADGKVWPYALMFFISGSLLTYHSTAVNFIGHVLGVVLMDTFAALYAVAMIHDPHASATAWWAYFSFGGIHGFNLSLMYVRHRGTGRSAEEGNRV